MRSYVQHGARRGRHFTIDGFWLRVDRSGGPDACHPWLAATRAGGYGVAQKRGLGYGAHRIAYTLTNGPIQRGMSVRHACDNPSCCNPRHLSLGTHADNMRDKAIRRRCRTGVAHHNVKLTDEAVIAIKRGLALGRTGAALAREFGISPSQISNIKRGLQRKDAHAR